MWVKHADLLEETEGVIVHGCNAQGKFNSGFAKQLRRKYPQVYDDYMDRFSLRGSLFLGEIIPTQISDKLIIVSGVTQRYYGRDPDVVYVDYPAVRAVFHQAAALMRKHKLPLKYPKIGCGLANGDWSTVQGIIYEELFFDTSNAFLFLHESEE